MRVAVIGAGVAGSFLAYLLSHKQIDCTVYEAGSSREKPCGGGCTAKVTARYPLFPAVFLPKNQVYNILYESGRRRSVRIRLRDPIWVYSRRELDGFLLEQAVNYGCQVCRRRVTQVERQLGNWLVHDAAGHSEKFDFLVGADGVTSIVRKKLAKPFQASDLSAAYGFYIPGAHHTDTIRIRFMDPELTGYLWAFPRVDHVSLGIMNSCKTIPAADLRQKLLDFAHEVYGIEDSLGLSSYAAPLPTLRLRTLQQLTVGSRDWALIGDAAGFADPITGEGISYAMRSAELLARSLANGAPAEYQECWRTEFGADLINAARLKGIFYRARFLGDSFIGRMLDLVERSPIVQSVQNDLIAGHASYAHLVRTLLLRSPVILSQAWKNRPRSRGESNRGRIRAPRNKDGSCPPGKDGL